jgi:hypothetical protein
VRVRSLPSLLAFQSNLVHGEDDWSTDKYELRESRKIDIIARYDPEGTSVDQVRSRYSKTRKRTWRAANLRKLKSRREKNKTREEISLYELKHGYPKEGSFFTPSNKKFRWILLFFCSFVTVSVWMQFDSIGALGNNLKNNTNGISVTEQQLGVLDAVYSIPNCILVLFGGILIDKLGLRQSMLIFSSFVVAGSIIMNLGYGFSIFWVMVLARAVFGIGAESLYVAQV